MKNDSTGLARGAEKREEELIVKTDWPGLFRVFRGGRLIGVAYRRPGG